MGFIIKDILLEVCAARVSNSSMLLYAMFLLRYSSMEWPLVWFSNRALLKVFPFHYASIMFYSFMVPTVVPQTPNDLLREHNTYEETVGKEDILCEEFDKIHQYMHGELNERNAKLYMYMPKRSEVQQGDGTQEGRGAPQDDDFSGDQTSASSLHSSPSSFEDLAGDPGDLIAQLERIPVPNDGGLDEFFD